MKAAQPEPERSLEADAATTAGPLLDQLGELATGLRFAANRQIFRAMLATSGAAAVLMHEIFPRRHWILPDERTVWSFAKLQARNLARLCGVTVTVHGLERIEDRGPFIFVANHQSHFDIAALLGFLPGDNRFATKKELFFDPILGRVLKTLGMIPIDRSRPADAIERLNALGDASFSTVIFPEGTRGRDGKLQPFRKGAFVAAIQLGVPVVPIAIQGTSAVMPKGGYLGIHPGTVEMIIEEPIDTNGLTYDDRDRLCSQVRSVIAQHVDPEAA